jgi:WD40 repeat protein
LLRSLIHPDRKASLAIVCFRADGKQLFTAGYPSGVLQFWDVAGGKEIRRIETLRGYRGSSAYADLPADWSVVYVPWEKRKVVRFEKGGERDFRIDLEGGVLVYDSGTGQEKPSLKATPGRGVLSADVSPDGHKVVLLERPSYQRNHHKPDEAVLWDVATGTKKILGPGYAMTAFTPDSRQFALTLGDYESYSGVLKLFDAGGAELAEVAKIKGEVFTWPRFSPDGKLLAVEQSKGLINQPATLRVWDVASRKELAAFKSGAAAPFLSYAFSPDGKRLAATDYNGSVRVWDIASGTPIREKVFNDSRLSHLAFSPDGRHLAVLGQPKWDRKDFPDPDPKELPQPRVYLFDLTTAAEPEAVMCPHGYVTGGLAFSPDGKLLAVGGAGATHFFDMTSAGRAK